MPMLAESVDAVIGVDTHTDTHTACLIAQAARKITAITVEATPEGWLSEGEPTALVRDGTIEGRDPPPASTRCAIRRLLLGALVVERLHLW